MSSSRLFNESFAQDEDLFFDQLFSDEEPSQKRNVFSQSVRKQYVPPPPSLSQLLLSQHSIIHGSQSRSSCSQSRTVVKVQPQKPISQNNSSSAWETFSMNTPKPFSDDLTFKETRDVYSVIPHGDFDEDVEERFSRSEREFQNEELADFEYDSYPYENKTVANQTSLQTPSQMTLTVPSCRGPHNASQQLRPVAEIPEQFRSIFSEFPYFNFVQSKVLDDVLYTDKPVVVCSPTGSGKTVVFELAIIRLLMNVPEQAKFKIVYMAPMKALCSERYEDWSKKFGPVGLTCKELTGDSEMDDYLDLQNANVVMTTPEKWDSMTRKWKDNRALVQAVRLFLIDEVHLLNDESRGPTMEAVISRMKTVKTAESRASHQKESFGANMRFLAISATIPNTEDIGEWLGTAEDSAISYSMDDSYRPVKLRKVVIGYSWTENMTNFRFDLSLNYKLSSLIQTYSDNKPTLVFCSTRKGAQQAGTILIKDARFVKNSEHRQRLQRCANSLHDSKLRELVMCGVGYHHAGLDVSDRKSVESMFTRGELPVLFATSTLAMGVNLPAHLVIIKSTMQYVKGVFEEYAESQILQMIGRAGRPQFDDSATAVIMTKNANKMKYEAIMGGTHNIESSLHKNLIEHLNAEIVLNTITDVSIALEWLKSTFLYIRILKNPTYYGIPERLDMEVLEKKLQEMCVKSLNTLRDHGLVHMVEGFDLRPTDTGKLMARYCIAFESIKLFLGLKGTEELSELLMVVCQCKEFTDLKIRNNEKRVLNTLNKDKNRVTVRFPVNGRIKTTEQKINCLIQATLGCLPINEFALNQDVTKIFRSGQRVAKCLYEFCMLQNNFNLLMNALQLSKCFRARLWENSKYVSKQLEKVGLTMSTMLVNAGLTTFHKIEETNPREIELIVNRHPPFGNQIREAAASLPKYEVDIEQKSNHGLTQAEIVVSVTMVNYIKRQDNSSKAAGYHFCVLLIADTDNKVVHKQRLADAVFFSTGTWSKKIEIQRASQSSELKIHIISQDMVGLDVQKTFTPYYTGPNRNYGYNTQNFRNMAPPALLKENTKQNQPGARTRQPCNHRCINKHLCAHECCKVGALTRNTEAKEKSVYQPKPKTPTEAMTRSINSDLDNFMDQLHARNQAIPATPGRKRLMSNFDANDFEFQPLNSPKRANSVDLTRFEYKPKQKYRRHVVEQVENVLEDFEDDNWVDLDFGQDHQYIGDIEFIDLTEDILNDGLEQDDWDYQYSYLDDKPSKPSEKESRLRQEMDDRPAYTPMKTNHWLSKDPPPPTLQSYNPSFNHRSMIKPQEVKSFTNNEQFAGADNVSGRPAQRALFSKQENPNSICKEHGNPEMPIFNKLCSYDFVAASEVVAMNNQQTPKERNTSTWSVDKHEPQPDSSCSKSNRQGNEHLAKRSNQRQGSVQINIASKPPVLNGQTRNESTTFAIRCDSSQGFFDPFSGKSDEDDDENQDVFKNIFADIF